MPRLRKQREHATPEQRRQAFEVGRRFREPPQRQVGTAWIDVPDRDLSDPVDAWRRVRALSPHIGAWTTLHDRRVTVWRARLDNGAFVPVEVQPEGKRRMDYAEFLRGIRA